MATTIITKYGSGAPTASDVVRGELAVDTENKRLYTEDSGGSVVELGTNPAANVTFGDNVKAIFGAGSDLQIYHNGSRSVITDQGTGPLRISATNLEFKNADETKLYANAIDGGAFNLYYDNSAKLATTSTGIDVTGTVTIETGSGNTYPAASTSADNLVISDKTASTPVGITIFSDNASQGNIFFGDENDADNGRIVYDHNGNANTMSFYANGAERLAIDSSGIDVTGTVTADGLTVSPSGTQQVLATLRANSGAGGGLVVQTDASDDGLIRGYDSSGNVQLQFDTDGGDNYIAQGNVGIGTSSPSSYSSASELVVDTGVGGGITVVSDSTTGGYGALFFADGTTGNEQYRGYVQYNHNNGGSVDELLFGTAGSEAMRIDSSGRLNVGQTNAYAPTGGGVSIATFEESSDSRTNLVISNQNSGSSAGASVILAAHGADYAIENQGSGKGGALTFTRGTSEAMRIDSSGNVGIGTSSPASALEVIGTDPNNNVSRVINIKDDRSYAADVGGGISLFGKYNSSGGYSTFAQIIGAKTNGTDGDYSGYLAFKTRSASALPAERMRIDSSGNVGIGTSSPDTHLHVQGSSGEIRVQDTGSGGGIVSFRDSGTSSIPSIQSSGNNLLVNTGGTERMRIDNTGNLLVGTSSQLGAGAYGLHEIRGDNSSGGASALVVYNSNAADSATAVNAIKNSATTTSSQRFIQFYCNAGATAMGGIVGNGASNAQFATLSDVREKTNIQSIAGSLDKINALNPVEFDWIASGEHINAGFVAQEVEQVFPEFVVENMAEEGAEERKGLTGGMTGGIVAHLVKAIQEQQDLIESLTARIAALEGAN